MERFFNIVNDIAFLRLDEPLEFNDNVKPIQVAAPGDEPSRGDSNIYFFLSINPM
jgi:hypothetical protein